MTNITPKSGFSVFGINIPTPNGNFEIVAGNGIKIQPAANGATISSIRAPNVIANGNGLAWQPPAFSNAKAPNNSIYFSNDVGKLVYKSANGSNVFALY
jgi:hypothetical protein